MLTPEQIKAAQDAFNSIDEAGGTLDECWRAALNIVASGHEKKLEAARKMRSLISVPTKQVNPDLYEAVAAFDRAVKDAMP